MPKLSAMHDDYTEHGRDLINTLEWTGFDMKKFASDVQPTRCQVWLYPQKNDGGKYDGTLTIRIEVNGQFIEAESARVISHPIKGPGRFSKPPESQQLKPLV